MINQKISRDKNQITLSGTVLHIDAFKTKTNIDAINLNLQVDSKYTDIIPCIAYGDIANKIISRIAKHDEILLVGRVMTIPNNTKIMVRIVIESFGKTT